MKMLDKEEIIADIKRIRSVSLALISASEDGYNSAALTGAAEVIHVLVIALQDKMEAWRR